jgi:hypothetical protein
MFVRVNTGAAPLIGDPRFPQRLGVAVPLLAPNADGFPRPQEAYELGEIEDQLVTALTSGGDAVFVLAITTGGAAEFVFYLSDATSGVASVERLGRASSGHELQHLAEADPEWELFQQFALEPADEADSLAG